MTRVALALILILAAAIRLHEIGRESLWSDEVLTHHIATKPLGQLFYDVAKFEQIPPVHHLIVHGWIRLFGDSESSLRFPSLIAGVASVWVIFLLGQRLIGTKGALVAALMLAVSPFHVIYAQEARAYTLMVLTGLLSTLAFVRLIERPSRNREVAYVLTSALLLYVHLYGGFVLAAHQVAFLVYLWGSRRHLHLPPGEGRGEGNRDDQGGEGPHVSGSGAHPHPNALPEGEGTRARTQEHAARVTFTRWFMLCLAIGMLFAPYLPTVRNWFKSVGINFWVKKVTWDDVSYAFNVYSGSVALYVLCIALIVVGVRAICRDRTRSDRASTIALLLSLLLLPVILPVLYSVLRTPVFSPRYGIVASTALYLLVGGGVAALRPGVLAVLLVGVLVGLNLSARPVDPWKAHWREASEYLAARMRPGDLAIVHIKASTRQYDYYVRSRRPDIPRIGFDGGAAPLTLPLDPGRHVWFVMYGVFAPPQKILDRGNWRVLSSKWFPDGILVMELDDEDVGDANPNDETRNPNE